MVRGMTSRALANMFITSCSFPDTSTALSFSRLDSSISVAPPPATTLLVLKHRRTIMMASLRERSASLMNCWAPPLRMMVADLVWMRLKLRWGTIRRGCNVQLRFVVPRSGRRYRARRAGRCWLWSVGRRRWIWRRGWCLRWWRDQRRRCLCQRTTGWLGRRWAVWRGRCWLRRRGSFAVFRRWSATRRRRCSGSRRRWRCGFMRFPFRIWVLVLFWGWWFWGWWTFWVVVRSRRRRRSFWRPRRSRGRSPRWIRRSLPWCRSVPCRAGWCRAFRQLRQRFLRRSSCSWIAVLSWGRSQRSGWGVIAFRWGCRQWRWRGCRGLSGRTRERVCSLG